MRAARTTQLRIKMKSLTNSIMSATNKHPHKLRVLLTNAFGLCSKLGDFQHSLRMHCPDVAIVTETKFTPDKASQIDLTFPGYSPPVRLDRTAHGGGVAVWVKSNLPFKDTESQEIVWLSIRISAGRTIGLCSAYRPGSSADTDISTLTAIDSGIAVARQSCTDIIVAGDLNVHLLISNSLHRRVNGPSAQSGDTKEQTGSAYAPSSVEQTGPTS